MGWWNVERSRIPKLGEHARPGRGGTRPTFRTSDSMEKSRSGTFSYAFRFSARARKTAPGAGALPLLFRSWGYSNTPTLQHSVLFLFVLIVSTPVFAAFDYVHFPKWPRKFSWRPARRCRRRTRRLQRQRLPRISDVHKARTK